MTPDEVFERYHDILKDFIFKKGWQSLNKAEIGAAQVLFNSEDNLLLCSGTASGKTEAAFFPIITKLLEEKSDPSFAVLYIAPLKSLINDQYSRMDELLEETGIPVVKWHGDAPRSKKQKALLNPAGIIEITPESLESMLMRRSNDIARIFHGLRYVVIDEIHTLTGSDRGNQILCQLERISEKAQVNPVRIGLSATVGNPEAAAAWLSSGTGRKTVCPDIGRPKMSVMLGIEHFFHDDEAKSDGDENSKKFSDAGYEYIYEKSKKKKCIVFSNSREETEYTTETLRQIARYKNEPDIFSIHHGNLSATIREEAEEKLKDEEKAGVTCATVTLELGIDIGRLERIIHNGSPYTVSSFLQRLGRSGRREAPPEMILVFREEQPLPDTPLPDLIPWDLLRAIAIIQLYAEERFIEPPGEKKLPFSLLFQQTLSVLASSGELRPAVLAARTSEMPPFKNVTGGDYELLYNHMLKHDYIEKTEEGGFIVGLAGEKIINSFRFFAVFKDEEDFTVRCESGEIGTLSYPPPRGDRFALAGRVWECDEADIERRLVFAHPVEGKMEVSWPGDYGEIDTRVMRRIKQVIEEDTVYPYLGENAKVRLAQVRELNRRTHFTQRPIVPLGDYARVFFPWLGTRSFNTLKRYLKANSGKYGIGNIESSMCHFIRFNDKNGTPEELYNRIVFDISNNGIDREELLSPGENPVTEKYDVYLPIELVREEYIADRMRTDEIEKYLSL